MLRTELRHKDLSDIRLQPGRIAGRALRLDRRATPVGWDLDTIRDADAVGQAAWLALAVPRGTLAGLGHPDFGSRLHLLIGALMTEQNVARARAYIRQALRSDPRFKLKSIDISRNAAEPGALMVEIKIAPEAVLTFDLASLINGEAATVTGAQT